MTIHKIRGTRDIIYSNSYTKIYTHLRSNLLLHNFQEINTPIFEYEKLFVKNLGLETDIVNKEMYYVNYLYNTEDEKKMVLRPELTTPIMRAYIENNIQNAPWKVFQIGPNFRHERPQKGRYREFYQCSIELINAISYGYDIELISMLYNLFFNLIENNFTLEINYIGNQDERIEFKNALYKYCLSNIKLFPMSIQEKLNLNNILRILDSKDPSIKEILIKAPTIEKFWNQNNQNEWNNITKNLQNLNISFTHNKQLIRGLDYYNGIIFEFTSKNLGAQNTFCGGGRYDSLSKNFNNKIIPSLGAGIGIDRLLLIIEELQINNLFEAKNFFIPIIFDSEINNAISYSIEIKNILEKNNIAVEIYFNKNSLKSSLKKANQEKAKYVIIINLENIINQTITIKNMEQEFEQTIIKIQKLAEYIQNNFQMIT